MKNNEPEVEEFDYVVDRKPPAPCCFGSTKRRNTNPIGEGLSPFQRRQTVELFPTGPGHYAIEKHNAALDRLLKKARSTKGVGGLASTEPRFKEKIFLRTPSPTRYNLELRVAAGQAKAPFGCSTRRFVPSDNKLPGPGTYGVGPKKCRRFMYNLGRPTMIPAIEVTCVSNPSDVCSKCSQICEGDYWHKDLIFLCHLCWEEEKRTRETYNEKQLKSFMKIRNCSFAHSHEGTSAAIRLLSPRKITKKLRLENYLNLYIKC